MNTSRNPWYQRTHPLRFRKSRPVLTKPSHQRKDAKANTELDCRPPDSVGGQALTVRNSTRQQENETMNGLTRWNQLRQLEALKHGLGSASTRSPGRALRRAGSTMAGRRRGPAGGHQRRRQGIPDQGPIAGSEERGREGDGGRGHADHHGRTEIRELVRRARSIIAWKYFDGSFVRNCLLPDDASPGKVDEKFKDGVLSVHFGQNREGQSPRKSKSRLPAFNYSQSFSSRWNPSKRGRLLTWDDLP